MGEVRLVSVPGDFDGDSLVSVADINQLANAVRTANQDAKLDLTGDGTVDLADHDYWLHTVKYTSLGDANLDRRFDSGDLVQIFQAGQYEDAIEDNSFWETGDWNADGDFTSSDLVVALAEGGYEQGSRRVIAAVPEPSSIVLLGVSVLGFLPQLAGRREPR